jgi:hypothetical protein
MSRESTSSATSEIHPPNNASALESFRRFAGLAEAAVSYSDLDVANDFTQLLNDQCDEHGDC